jgi:uncharacterized surface protein with fasciclin (FAS1) repeats
LIRRRAGDGRGLAKFGAAPHPTAGIDRSSDTPQGRLQETFSMTRTLRITLAAALMAGIAPLAYAKNPMVGGAAMFPTKNIVENAVNSKDHTTLVAAVKAADLVDTLSGAGPFTVFAPTNAAFAKLPAGTVDTLLKPENKGQLSAVLTYHVVPGRITAAQIAANAKAHHGTATYTTVQGGTLSFKKAGNGWTIMDQKGDTGRITIANVMQSNGVIHVIDTVMLP